MNANAKSSTVNATAPRPGRPVQDEWGIFDPEQAGLEAAIAALETPGLRSSDGNRSAATGAALTDVAHCRSCAQPLPAGARRCPTCERRSAETTATVATGVPTSSSSSEGTSYALEFPIACPQCRATIQSFRVFRLIRTQVSFTSTLPRKGYVVVCPECEQLLATELSGLI